jgi:hypothetical protein
MSSGTYTQVAPNSSGARIRLEEVIVPQTDGTVATVEQQVVTLADSDGTEACVSKLQGTLELILIELTRIRVGLSLQLGIDFSAITEE